MQNKTTIHPAVKSIAANIHKYKPLTVITEL
jgi:hypothetical protein